MRHAMTREMPIPAAIRLTATRRAALAALLFIAKPGKRISAAMPLTIRFLLRSGTMPTEERGNVRFVFNDGGRTDGDSRLRLGYRAVHALHNRVCRTSSCKSG